jgi:hypothetical protein
VACDVLNDPHIAGGYVRRELSLNTLQTIVVWIGSVMVAAVVVASQARAETFTADAKVKKANGSDASAALTVTVRSFATDTERDALVAAVKRGGAAARELLTKRPDAGSIQIGATATPIKYAYERAVGSGRLITLVTAEPIHFVGGELENAKPKAGYDLGLVLLDVDAAKPGHGEVAPAAKVRVDAQNAIVTEDYGAEVVRLSNVVKK